MEYVVVADKATQEHLVCFEDDTERPLIILKDKAVAEQFLRHLREGKCHYDLTWEDSFCRVYVSIPEVPTLIYTLPSRHECVFVEAGRREKSTNSFQTDNLLHLASHLGRLRFHECRVVADDARKAIDLFAKFSPHGIPNHMDRAQVRKQAVEQIKQVMEDKQQENPLEGDWLVTKYGSHGRPSSQRTRYTAEMTDDIFTFISPSGRTLYRVKYDPAKSSFEWIPVAKGNLSFTGNYKFSDHDHLELTYQSPDNSTVHQMSLKRTNLMDGKWNQVGVRNIMTIDGSKITYQSGGSYFVEVDKTASPMRYATYDNQMKTSPCFHGIFKIESNHLTRHYSRYTTPAPRNFGDDCQFKEVFVREKPC